MRTYDAILQAAIKAYLAANPAPITFTEDQLDAHDRDEIVIDTSVDGSYTVTLRPAAPDPQTDVL